MHVIVVMLVHVEIHVELLITVAQLAEFMD
jgi:hypothetical protein